MDFGADCCSYCYQPRVEFQSSIWSRFFVIKLSCVAISEMIGLVWWGVWLHLLSTFRIRCFLFDWLLLKARLSSLTSTRSKAIRGCALVSNSHESFAFQSNNGAVIDVLSCICHKASRYSTIVESVNFYSI